LTPLRYGKELATMVFLQLLGGLDFYIWRFPHEEGVATPEEVFRYQFARNRYMVRNWKSVRSTASDPAEVLDLLHRGRQLYASINDVDKEKFTSGRYDSWTFVSALYRAGAKSECHILPIDAVELATLVVTEAMLRFEALRREPLIFDSTETFREPLPHALAYLRYNAWDIYFVLWALDILDMVLNTRATSRIGSERLAMGRLRDELSAFRRLVDRSTWTILDRWRCDESYILRHPVVRERATSIRKVLAEAAHRSDEEIAEIGLPGSEERSYGKALATEADMESALPLFHAISERSLWGAVAVSGSAHSGPKGMPWMGSHAVGAFSPEPCSKTRASPLGLDVGRNGRRFFFVHYAYQLAFSANVSVSR
jgi:hypothetical protein